MFIPELSLKEIKIKVEKALKLLHEKDNFLLEVNASERSITCKLASYLQEEFEGYDVDSEYNRQGPNSDPKTVNINYSKRRVYPDIIIHHRLDSENNLLAIEVKKSINPATKKAGDDLNKLVAYKNDLDYKYGLFLILYKGGKTPYIKVLS